MTGPSLLEAAVWYPSRGFYVFPLYGIAADGRCECQQARCKSPGKHPASEARKGFHDATCDADEIRRIWTANPNRNIGLSVGASGYGVLDIDCGTGKDGEASLAKLIARCGPLPESWEVETGSGGRHIYFRDPKFPTGINSYGEPHIDTRGVGGYVVAPPSRHVSGQSYKWKEGRGPDHCEIAVAPAWLLNTTPSRHNGGGRSLLSSSIQLDPTTGLVVDGRETYLRDITCAAFWRLLHETGGAPDAVTLQARVWNAFSKGADLTDGRWSASDATKYARNIIRRYKAGKLNTTPSSNHVVRDVAPFYGTPHLEGEGASQRLIKIIQKYVATLEKHILAKAELALFSTSLEHLDSGKRATELRKARAELCKRYGSKCFEPPRLQIAAPAGLGKTSWFLQLFAQSPYLSTLHIDYYIPTIDRARELEQAFHAAFAREGRSDASSRVRVMCGRSNPKHGRCHEDRKSLVAAVEKKAFSVYNTMCVSLDAGEGDIPIEVKCPFHGRCEQDGYLSQFTNTGPMLRIWPHAQLPLPQSKELKLPDADLIIVDESCVTTLCKATRIAMSELTNAQNYVNSDGAIDLNALETGRKVLGAICLEQGSLQLGSLIAAHITSDDLRAAEAAARDAAQRSALVVQPHWSPDSIQRKIDHHQYNGGGVIAGILGALATSLDGGSNACTAVSLEAPRGPRGEAASSPPHELVWSRISDPRVPKAAGLLLLDADANIDFNRRLWGMVLRHVTIRAKRRGYVKQVYDAPYTNYTLTSQNGSGLRANIKALVECLVASGKKVLIGCNRGVRCALTGETGQKLPQAADWCGASVTHFGAFVGSNAWERYDVVIVLGREQPPPTAVENTARALWPDEELNLPGAYTSEVRGYDLRNGERAGVEVTVHPEPRVQMILELSRERASGQLMDRLRLMYPDDRQPEILLISNIPIPGVTVDELISLNELVAGGCQWKRALSEVGGVLPLQSEFLVRALPHIFPSPSTAARAVSELHLESWRRPVGARIVQYRHTPRGPLSSALVAGDVKSLEGHLAAHHRTDLGQIVVKECQTAEPSQPANNTISDVTGFVRLSHNEWIGVIPKPNSRGSLRILARQLGKTVDAIRMRFQRGDHLETLKAAYEAPGSFWRLHLKDERYAVDVKLPSVPHGDHAAAHLRVMQAGLEISWLIPIEAKKPAAKVIPSRPKKRRRNAVKPTAGGARINYSGNSEPVGGAIRKNPARG